MRRFCALAFAVVPNYAFSSEITFRCSWLDRAPIEIQVDVDAAIATRTDGGRQYRVIKLSSYAVWLAVDDPDRQVSLALQMIERSTSKNVSGGKWLDLIISADGGVSPILGGVCWEQ